MRHEEAKQKVLKEQKEARLKKDGFVKYDDGFSFPGMNDADVQAAVERRKLVRLEEKHKPSVKFNLMSVSGQLVMSFSHEMMFPDTINSTILNKLLTLKVVDENSDEVYVGRFRESDN